MGSGNATKRIGVHEYIRLGVETIGMVTLVVTLIYTARSANAAKESVAKAKVSVDAAIASVDATREQIGESKYQSVYQQQRSARR